MRLNSRSGRRKVAVSRPSGCRRDWAGQLTRSAAGGPRCVRKRIVLSRTCRWRACLATGAQLQLSHILTDAGHRDQIKVDQPSDRIAHLQKIAQFHCCPGSRRRAPDVSWACAISARRRRLACSSCARAAACWVGGMAALATARPRCTQFPGGQSARARLPRRFGLDLQLPTRVPSSTQSPFFTGSSTTIPGCSLRSCIAVGFRAAIDDQLDHWVSALWRRTCTSGRCSAALRAPVPSAAGLAVAQESAGEEPEDRSEADQQGDEERAVLAEVTKGSAAPPIRLPARGDLFRPRRSAARRGLLLRR